MAEERRASHEKHRERGKADAGDGVLPVRARTFAPVRQAGTDSFQVSEQGLQNGHHGSESWIAPRRQAESSWTVVQHRGNRRLSRIRPAPGRPDPQTLFDNETQSHLELLALVRVTAGFAHRPACIRRFAPREPGFAETAVVFDIEDLMSLGDAQS